MIFILGSPRTGSTLIYQFLIDIYNLSFFNNLTNNYFYKYPFIGTYVSQLFSPNIKYESNHGKTKGLLEPSEGSNIFMNWFESSNNILSDKRKNILKTFENIDKYISKPIVTKNAWNCFRIKTLTKLFPNIKFVWIKGHNGDTYNEVADRLANEVEYTNTDEYYEMGRSILL